MVFFKGTVQILTGASAAGLGPWLSSQGFAARMQIAQLLLCGAFFFNL